MVPAIIRSTLKSMAPKIWFRGSMPVTMKIKAEPKAIYGRYLLKASIKT